MHETLPHLETVIIYRFTEIMMDDLDYRFYKEDLIHPNQQAIQYIWEKFRNAYFSEEVKDFITENYKIKAA